VGNASGEAAVRKAARPTLVDTPLPQVWRKTLIGLGGGLGAMSGTSADEILETIVRWQSLQIYSVDKLTRALAEARIEGYQFADTTITEILKQRGEYDENAVEELIEEKRKSSRAV
jgi:hypothetical protein